MISKVLVPNKTGLSNKVWPWYEIGATTFRLTTFFITTLSITTFSTMAFIIMPLSIPV